MEWRRPEAPALLASEADEVDLDAHLEEQEDDADVGEQLELARSATKPGVNGETARPSAR